MWHGEDMEADRMEPDQYDVLKNDERQQREAAAKGLPVEGEAPIDYSKVSKLLALNSFLSIIITLDDSCYDEIFEMFDAEIAKTLVVNTVKFRQVLFSFEFFTNPFGMELYYVEDLNSSTNAVVLYTSVLTALHFFQCHETEFPELLELERKLQQEKNDAERFNLRISDIRIQNSLLMALSYMQMEDPVEMPLSSPPELKHNPQQWIAAVKEEEPDLHDDTEVSRLSVLDSFLAIMYTLNDPCYRDIIGMFNTERAITIEVEDVDIWLFLFSFGVFTNPFGAEFYHVDDLQNSASGVIFYTSVLTAFQAFEGSMMNFPESRELEERLQQEKDYAERHNLRVANYRIQNCLLLALAYLKMEDPVKMGLFSSPDHIPIPSLHYFTVFLNPFVNINDHIIRPICSHVQCRNLQCFINFFKTGIREWNAPPRLL